MAETSAIQWTDATVNFWWGCTKVGPGCDHCYAEGLNAFRGNGQWGVGAPRRKIKGAVALIRKLQREADRFESEHGRRRRVFMHSMSDLFDKEVPDDWRAEALAEAEAADRLDIQFVTKRVGNALKAIPASWKDRGWPKHIGLLATMCTQDEVDRDLDKLKRLRQWCRPAFVGLSVEPLLGPMNLSFGLGFLDWVIVGGESGAGARPMQADWARSLRDQCRWAGIPFFFKQWGAHRPTADANGPYMMRAGRFDVGGRLLDGVEHNAMPRIAA